MQKICLNLTDRKNMLKKKSQFDFLKQGFTYEKESLQDPRKQMDQIKSTFYAVLIISLLLLGMSLYHLMGAMPQTDTFFSRFFQARLNYSWNMERLEISARYSLGLMFVSLAAIGLNLQRLKRKGDTFDYFNLFTCIYAIGSIIFYLMKR